MADETPPSNASAPVPPTGGTPVPPANPEMANVSVNRPSAKGAAPSAVPKTASSPAPQQAAAPVPTKIGKEVTRKKSNTRFLLGFGAFLIFLFVLFLVLMVFVMSRGAGDNAVIAAFGLAPGAIKAFLVTVINLAFGFLSLLFFVLAVIGVFRLAGAKKGDTEKRSSAAKMVLFSLLPFFFLVVLWFFLFNFITKIDIAAERVTAEIIVSNPEDISNLEAPVEVTFSAHRVKQALSASRLAVSSASWDLDGDGYYEEPVNASGEVTRLYKKRGFYNVALSVEVVGEKTPRVYNLLLDIKNALFEIVPDTGTAPLDVKFDATDLLPSNAKLESVDWDFDGDGIYDLSGSDNVKATYRYEQVGTYKVQLRVVDENSTVEVYYRDLEVTLSSTPPLSARIQALPGLKGMAPFTVNLDGGKSSSLKGKIVGYEWNFGDRTPSQKGKTVSHVYEQPGVYPLTLTVTEDTGQTAEITLEIEAQKSVSAPKAVIRSVPAGTENVLTGPLPLRVQLDASASTDPDRDIVDYEWDFDGDGKADQTGQKVERVFDVLGASEVTLTVRDSEQNESTASLKVEVTAPTLQAVISADPAEGTVPLTVHFDASASSAFQDSIVSYEWNFGDGSNPTITGATIDHRYTGVGSYTVTLKVTTGKNGTATATQPIFVREIPLKACFSPSRDTGAAPLSVTFDPQCSTGAVATYQWQFGDGIESSSRKPAHTFEKPGTYNATLTVADDKNNVSVYSQVITVQGAVQP